MIRKLILLGFLSAMTLPGFALLKPRSLVTDSRIKVVNYQKNNVVSINGTTFITTQVIFSNHEKIIDVEGGDAAAWTVNIDKYLPNILNIKPTVVSSHSNLSVVTINDHDQYHYYHFQLNSNSQRHQQQQTYVIRFVYPHVEYGYQQNLLRSLGLSFHRAYTHPNQYHWYYTFSGSPVLKPKHVFDDGRFTYIEFHRGQLMPAVFAVDDASGNESVVNYRISGKYIVIQRLARQFTLRSGPSHVASLFNQRLITERLS